MSKKILVWFRNDLRVHDNGVLVEAIAKSDEILPVYFFDPRYFETTKYQTVKTGLNRAQFLIDSVLALRQSFQAFGGDLLVVKGKPEELLPGLVSENGITEVYHHREVASEETAVSTRVEDLLWKLKVNLKHIIGHTLYNKEDLPFPIKDIPDAFAQFKKKTERDAIVKPCFLTPTQIHFVQQKDWGTLPSLAELIVHEQLPAEADKVVFKGGEQSALQLLDEFLELSGAASAQTTKKLDMVSKLSPWLSLGCLSPREVYWKMKEAETKFGTRLFCKQVLQGLLWRDYYRFMLKKYGNTFFKPAGFNKNASPLSENPKALQAWKTASTPQDLVNLHMKELNETGYINSAARILLATYFVYELKLNWVLGAAYFEEKLIDYTPASNWGNWANVAGVGNDEKLTTSYCFTKQLKFFDPKAVEA